MMMRIDRKQLVQRHNPRMERIEPLSPLSVGNGSFAFTADVTGLQTFPDRYAVPLGTQSHWAWHSTGGRDAFRREQLAPTKLDTYGREVGYPLAPAGNPEAYHWLRQNPHRLQLGQIGLRLARADGSPVQAEELERIGQVLNLWEGALYSEFAVEGIPVSVATVCHPDRDQLAVLVTSPLIAAGRLQAEIRFPAPDMTSDVWEESVGLDFGRDDRHRSERIDRPQAERAATIRRSMDDDGYDVALAWNGGRLEQAGAHAFVLRPEAGQAELELSALFVERGAAAAPGPYREALEASKRHWARFWTSGAAVDFSACSDPRAFELERRVVLSQFLTALHSAGPLPPQETGLMYNSWYGKFHLEMHWWHAAHFPLWGRAGLLERGMGWYADILPKARELASSQGYAGARWPKQVGPDGAWSPSPISPVLIWQQPHPIALAELLYRADPTRKTLLRWKAIVKETADFMASYAHWDEGRGAYVLGPPLIPAQECHRPEVSVNPPYELEYWKYGLETAIRWLERLEEPIPPAWRCVARLIDLPPHADGVYLAHANCPDTFVACNHDHPSMLGALGILPGSLIDPGMMRRTLQRVKAEWQWDTAWGWDFPMCAMTAARLGEPEEAVSFLLMDAAKNTYLPNGHNYQRAGLTCYLPGNGGLLTAVAMMAAGWQGAPDRPHPGFPADGGWNVRSEGLLPYI